MSKRFIRLTESDLRQVISETINEVVKEADRHREGYWKERWAKQKAAKKAETKEQNTPSEQSKKSTKPKKDRHRKGYYHDYNKAHPERLNRGFTKGYKNGNVSDGPIIKQNPGNVVYDALGRAHSRDFYNPTMTDMINWAVSRWHDDDWEEGPWGE